MTQQNEHNGRKAGFLAGMGAGALKSLATDAPKGTIEKVTERSLHNKMHGFPVRDAFKLSSIKSSLMERGLPRVLGGVTVGALTFPLMASGIKDIQSDDQSTKAKGVAKVLGSGLAYGSLKGGVSYALDKPIGNVPFEKSFRKRAWSGFKTGVSAKSVPSLLSAAALAGTVAYGMKRDEKRAAQGKKTSGWSAPLLAAGVGGVMGMVKQFPETVTANAETKNFKGLKAVAMQPKKWLPRTVGAGVSSALGGLATGYVISKLMSNKSKSSGGG